MLALGILKSLVPNQIVEAAPGQKFQSEAIKENLKKENEDVAKIEMDYKSRNKEIDDEIEPLNKEIKNKQTALADKLVEKESESGFSWLGRAVTSDNTLEESISKLQQEIQELEGKIDELKDEQFEIESEGKEDIQDIRTRNAEIRRELEVKFFQQKQAELNALKEKHGALKSEYDNARLELALLTPRYELAGSLIESKLRAMNEINDEDDVKAYRKGKEAIEDDQTLGGQSFKEMEKQATTTPSNSPTSTNIEEETEGTSSPSSSPSTSRSHSPTSSTSSSTTRKKAVKRRLVDLTPPSQNSL